MMDGHSSSGDVPYFLPPASARLGTVPPHMLPASVLLPRKKRWGALYFWILFSICLINLNGLGQIIFRIERVFSILMLLLCLLILGIFRFTVLRDVGKTGRIYLLFMVMYLLIAGRTGFFGSAVERYLVFYQIRTLIPAILVMVSCAMVARHLVLAYSPDKTIRTLFICSLLPVGALYLGFFWDPLRTYVAESRGGRFSGFFPNANSAGFAVCFSAAVGFAYLVSGKWKMLAIAGIVAAGIAIIPTFSRSAILTFMLLVITQVIISPIFKRKSVLLAVFVVIAGLGSFFLLGLGQIEGLSFGQTKRLEGIVRIASFSPTEGDLGDRLEFAVVGVQHWLMHPIMGNGIGYMSSIQELGGLGVHNTYLLILGNAGIFPAMFFLMFLVIFLYEAWMCPILPLRTLSLGFLTVFVLRCMVGHSGLEDKNIAALMGICMGTLAAAKELHRRKVSARHIVMRPINI